MLTAHGYVPLYMKDDDMDWVRADAVPDRRLIEPTGRWASEAVPRAENAWDTAPLAGCGTRFT
ncbi:hypothetical protein G6045_08865 [Streptomyces sp. YC504]|uniref:Uncharacterized protein n=1 Tax=Streptomyces mesophilus TaxID=1775132 RepID=A0A6G4XEX1_9ACTN|nr:hypothetical protein [Streptomyces mesophilus]NGO75783.1 hypothetical protein [Streptomyces mesophilus]